MRIREILEGINPDNLDPEILKGINKAKHEDARWHAERMQRARDMGFDTEHIYYHGSGNIFSTFIISQRGKLGKGVYITPNVNYALRYGDANYPLLLRGNIATRKDARNLIPDISMLDRNQVNRALRDLGFSAYHAIDEGLEREIIVFDPSNLRSLYAKFDPSKKHSSDIMA